MNVALLIIAVVGTLAAIAAAVFSYPPWRERFLKPSLELRVRNVAGYSQSGPIIVSATLELEAWNSGRGEARNWRVELQTRGLSSGSLEFMNPRTLRLGEEKYQLPGELEVVAWRAVDAVEVIPPGDKSRSLGPCRIGLARGVDFICDYSITASRMKPRTGTVTVFSDRPEARVD